MRLEDSLEPTGSVQAITNSAPVPPDGTAHTVQFYQDQAVLIDAVARFAGAALVAGDACVILARPELRAGLATKLADRGLDLDRIAAQGRFLALDAAAVLDAITAGGEIVPGRFRDEIAPIIGRAVARAVGDVPRAAVFGELVALLSEAGKSQQAIRLELLWEDLIHGHPISLFCGYPLSAFAQAEDAAAVAEICAAHEHVVPVETYAMLADDGARARAVVRMQQQALALSTEMMRRTLLEAERGQHEAEPADFIERVPVPLHRVHPDGTILWANRAELDLLGYDRDEYVGQNVSTIHREPAVVAGVLAALGRGETIDEQPAQIVRRDGSFRHVLISSLVGRDGGTFYCMTQDVTDQMTVIETGARLAAIIDSSDDAIVGKMLDGTITNWNPAAERLFGYTAEEIVGSSIARLVPPERRGELRDILARLARGERIAHHETERVRKDGRRIAISVSISPIHDQHGKIIGVAKVARDISERRYAERRHQELLEIVAHELRTPLTTVLGYAQLVQRRLGDDEAVAAISTQANQMSRLLADVLETARLESGRHHLRLTPFDLTALTRSCARQAALLADERRIRVEAPTGPIVGVWDSDRVAQILTNLLDNAVKHAPHAQIVVRVATEGDSALVSVGDNGPGISRAHQAHLFDRFYQVNAGTATGVGLGLFISRTLAEAHGGRLAVESAPGRGSTFTLTLPLAVVTTQDTDSSASVVEMQPVANAISA